VRLRDSRHSQNEASGIAAGIGRWAAARDMLDATAAAEAAPLSRRAMAIGFAAAAAELCGRCGWETLWASFLLARMADGAVGRD